MRAQVLHFDPMAADVDPAQKSNHPRHGFPFLKSGIGLLNVLGLAAKKAQESQKRNNGKLQGTHGQANGCRSTSALPESRSRNTIYPTYPSSFFSISSSLALFVPFRGQFLTVAPKLPLPGRAPAADVDPAELAAKKHKNRKKRNNGQLRGTYEQANGCVCPVRSGP
jgi:hypothetical protein